MNQVYQIITDRIVAKLEEGVIPWKRPWTTAGPVPRAMNWVSKRPYNGVNALLLSYSGYGCSYWATFNQIKERGGMVRKGERSTPVVYFKIWHPTDQEGEDRRIPIMRYYNVFNLEQVDGVEWGQPVVEYSGAPGEIVGAYQADGGPAIVHAKQDRAYYRLSTDTVTMPTVEQFADEALYYHTLFHELAHSTGHASRLDRDDLGKAMTFGSERYAQEELTAEIAAGFLCAEAGIDWHPEETAGYLKSWIDAIKGDPKLIVSAASRAEKAAGWVLGKRAEREEEAAA